MPLINTIAFSLSLLATGISPVANNDSITYQKVISCKGTSKAILFRGLEEALYSTFDSAAVSAERGDELNISIQFTIYNRLIGKVGNPAGKLEFNFTVDVKDEKFRYTASDFYFTPMERNRFGRFETQEQYKEVVVTGNYKHRKSLLKKIEKQSKEYLNELVGKLKDEVLEKEENEIKW